MAGLLAVSAAAFPVAGVAFASQNMAAQPRGSDTLGDLDREFLTVIRFANLWEIPMGELGVERGTTQEVKDAGAAMLEDHTKLNVVVEDLADKYGVQLPNQPTSSQRAWIDEISSKQGEEFNEVFADRLRAAHGSVFNLIAEVRAGTDNTTIRDFATQANDIVLKHMTLLEATGYVTGDHGDFSEAAARTSDYPENRLSSDDLMLGGVTFLVVALGTVLGVRTLSARGAAK